MYKKRMVKKWSVVWDHFSMCGKDKATCAYCSGVLSCKGGSTTNFVRHLKSKHPGLLYSTRQTRDPEENVILIGAEQQKSEHSTSEQEHLQPPIRKKADKKWSTVWNHFYIIEKEKVKCVHCAAVLSNKCGSTTNLVRHLKSKHPRVLNSKKRPRVTPTEKKLRSVLHAVQSQRWVYGTPPTEEDQKSENGTTLGRDEEKQSEDGTTAGQEPTSINTTLRENLKSLIEAVTREMGTPPREEEDQKIEPGKECKSVFKRKKMNKRPALWDHFIKSGEAGKCVYCSAVLSYDGGSMTRHLKTRHPRVLNSKNKTGSSLALKSVQRQTYFETAVRHEEQDVKEGFTHATDNDVGNLTTESEHRSAVRTAGTHINGEDDITIRHLVEGQRSQVVIACSTDVGLECIKTEVDDHVIEYGTGENETSPTAGQESTMTQAVFTKTIFENQKHRKRSAIWSHFSECGTEAGRCVYCSVVLSYKGGSTTNFIRHLKARHPAISRTGLRTGFQSSLTKTDHCNRPSSVTRRRSKVIDDQFVRMVVKEYQPLTLGEDTEFCKFIKMLNPRYKLPSEKNLSESLIPELFEKTKERVKNHLNAASAVSITTDSWTSITIQSYIAITVHFIDEKWLLRSYLLDCFEYGESDTPEVLTEEIKRVLTEWNIENKVVAVVSDNASNVKAAVKFGNWRYVSCFAHSINFIVQNAIEEIHEVHQKVKTIVGYLVGSPEAMDKIKSVLEQTESSEIELKQDVGTCWTSTYEMLLQVLKLKFAISSSLGLVQTPLPKLYPRDWSVIEKACEVLRVFYEVTEEMSHEKSVSISKVMLLSEALQACTLNLMNAEGNDLPVEISKMIREISDQMSYRFLNEEELPLLAESTLLDPRFKQHGFEDANLLGIAYDSVAEMASNLQNYPTTDSIASVNQLVPEKKAKKSLIWGEFESKMNIVCSTSTTASEINELDSYLQEPNIDRTADPLKWWESKQSLYPRLFHLAKSRLCVVATSVPCERIFSLHERLISERRNLLTSRVSQILFLNANL